MGSAVRRGIEAGISARLRDFTPTASLSDSSGTDRFVTGTVSRVLTTVAAPDGTGPARETSHLQRARDDSLNRAQRHQRERAVERRTRSRHSDDAHDDTVAWLKC